MSTLAMVAHQARYDLRAFVRDPRARGFTLALPVLLLVIFGAIFKSHTFDEPGYTISADAYYVPRMIVLVAAWGVAAAFFAVRRFSWLPGQR